MEHSAVGRLLHELSWEGNSRRYREGGRGLESVLPVEGFHASTSCLGPHSSVRFWDAHLGDQ